MSFKIIAGQVALLICLAAVPSAITAFVHPLRPDWRSLRAVTVTTQSAVELRQLGNRVLWIDIRPAADFANGHILSALPLTQEGWDDDFARIATTWNPDFPLVVYGGGPPGEKSRHTARRLAKELGVTSIRVLEGGWPAWSAPKP
ncbi:MAG: rhodanese-like domain-containing protein [Opitutaceae bacterium]|nr:rhodanese-like domain-containing protein [Opitutaceae bacterium]